MAAPTFLLLLLVLVNAACRATPPAEEPTPEQTLTQEPGEMQPTEIAASEAPPSEAPPTEQRAAEPSPTAGPTEEPAAATPSPALLLNIPGLAEITLLTPVEGAGPKPRFEWEAVDGATSYTLILYHPEGEPYWAWQGEGTAVYLGGGDPDVPPPEDSAGPVLLDGMTWAVMASGAEGRLVASSLVRPISP